MIKSTTKSESNSKIISTNLLGLAFTLLSALYLMITVGGSTGRTVILISSLPLFLVFRWASEPLVHILTGEEAVDEEIPEDSMSDLKDEHRIATIKKAHHEDLHAYIDGEEWVCVCGTRNHLDRDDKIQNCSHCFRSRDYVLGNYTGGSSLQEKSNKLEDALKRLAAA